MKTVICTFILLGFIYQSKAQYYVRTKKNIGILGMYNLRPEAKQQNLAATTPFLQLGLCRQFGKYAVPEIGITLAAPSSTGLDPTFEGLFTGLQLRKNLIKINQRKHGAKCKAELLECFVTPEYRYSLNDIRNSNQSQFSVRYGLGLYHVESGGSKRAKAWVTKVEAYHRTYIGGTQDLPHEFGIALRIQHFKTYDFLR
jgi:hypothetical protein